MKDILSKDSNPNDVKATSYGNKIIEIANSFTSSNNFFLAYCIQTTTKLLITVGLLSWLVYRCWDTVNKGTDVGSVMCYVYEYWYECSGHPRKLYVYVTIIASFLLLLHIVLNVYNMVWLSFPKVGAMSSVMERYFMILIYTSFYILLLILPL